MQHHNYIFEDFFADEVSVG